MSGYRTLPTDAVLSSARFIEVMPLVHEPRRMRVMVVDDSAVQRLLFDGLLSAHTHCDIVHSAVDGLEGMSAVAEHRPDIVVSDLHMPNATGLELLVHIKRNHPGVEVVIVSGEADVSEIQGLMDAGAHAVLRKPVSAPDFHAAIDAIRANLESIQV